MAGKDLSDSTEGVLAYGSEDGRGGEVPELYELPGEFSNKIAETIDWLDVIGICNEGGGK